ncbi:hypothetical protein BJY00DRAFT_318658 [Aspergillus carlsbadensis]|nr:hypothetical protein BJY00DRAFT_318658 [Aspergillus carlsbadensis]
MSSSPNLPFEVHLMILEYCDFRTLHPYTLLCKRTAPTATRYLYRELNWGPPGDIQDWSCKTIQKLLRTLKNRPQLGRLIKSVHLDVEYEYEFRYQRTYLEKQRIYPSDGESTKLGWALVRELGLQGQVSWRMALEGTSLAPWIALLLSQLTSMEELTLGPPLLHKSLYIGWMFQDLVRTEPHRFDRLRRVCFAGPDEGNHTAGLDYRPELYASLFRLPSLNELDLTLHTPRFVQDAAAGSGSLKTLRLLRSRLLSTENLINLVTLVPALEALHLGWSTDYWEKDEFIDFADLGAALTQRSSTLKALTIAVHRYNDDLKDHPVDFDETWTKVPLGRSLRALGVLEHLDIPLPVLLGRMAWASTLAETLPTSLRSLVLHSGIMAYADDGEGDPWISASNIDPWPTLSTFITSLHDYLNDSTAHAPHLESVLVDFSCANSSVRPRARAEKYLRSVAEANHVSVDIIYFEPAYSGPRSRITLSIYDQHTPDLVPVIRSSEPEVDAGDQGTRYNNTFGYLWG